MRGKCRRSLVACLQYFMRTSTFHLPPTYTVAQRSLSEELKRSLSLSDHTFLLASDARSICWPETTASYITAARRVLCAAQFAMARPSAVAVDHITFLTGRRGSHTTTTAQSFQVAASDSSDSTPCHCSRSIYTYTECTGSSAGLERKLPKQRRQKLAMGYIAEVSVHARWPTALLDIASLRGSHRPEHNPAESRSPDQSPTRRAR